MNKEIKNLSGTANSRLLGVYPQKQEGLFMQRIKVPGGRISWQQWRKVIEVAKLYTPGCPLHITTRQDIELHNAAESDLDAIQRGLGEVGLAILGGGGDTVRNITVCAGCGMCEESFDLMPLAQALEEQLKKIPAIFNLPRKFKISFSGCEKACAKPWINDMGFVAQKDGLFTVIGAGSLGAKPLAGILLYKDLPAGDIVPLTLAAVEFFEKEGDREKRTQARFRHVRERLGEQAFSAELERRFGEVKKRQMWPSVVIEKAEKKNRLLWRLQLPNGNISRHHALELADIGQLNDAVLRINLEQGLELYGAESFELGEELAAFVENPVIISCPGSATCPKGLADCGATADKLRQKLKRSFTGDKCISISGCPNNCAQSAAADIGLTGMLRKKDGKTVECYRLFTGGGNGRNDKLAAPSEIVFADDVPAVIEKLLEKGV